MDKAHEASHSGLDGPYDYHPSSVLALVAAVAFSISALMHFFQYVRHRAWFFYVMLLGLLMELAGYWLRYCSTKNLSSLSYYSSSYPLIMLAPSLMAAACYMAFGRIIYWVTPDIHRGFRSLWVPARFLAPFFVLFDVVAFCIQLLGLVLILSKTSTSKPEHENQKGNGMAQGIEILCLGLIIQAVVVGAFALLAARFLIVSRQWRYAWPEGGSPTWRSMAWIIILASILVMFRTLFRILEFTLSSSQNYLTHHEWPLYAFDALPILLVLTSFNSIHPGRYMPKAYITLNHNFKHVPKEPEFKSTPSIRMEEEQYPSYPLAAVTAQRYAPSPLRPVIGNSF